MNTMYLTLCITNIKIQIFSYEVTMHANYKSINMTILSQNIIQIYIVLVKRALRNETLPKEIPFAGIRYSASISEVGPRYSGAALAEIQETRAFPHNILFVY